MNRAQANLQRLARRNFKLNVTIKELPFGARNPLLDVVLRG